MVKQAPFKPTDIGGCQMWLDGADTTTITGNITSIREKANNVSLSVSGTVTATTIGSQSSLNFDGTDYLFGNINNILTGTSFVVFKATAANNWYCPFFTWRDNAGQANFPAFGYIPGGNLIGPYTTFVGVGTPTTSVTIGNTYLTSYSWSGTTTNIGFNGATPTSGTQPAFASSETRIWIAYDNGETGNGGYTTVNIGEILLYNSVLGTAQRQQIEAYLAQKWGLQPNLPQGHPGTRGVIYPIQRLPNASALPYPSAFIPTQIQSGTCQLWLDAEDIFGNGTVPSNGATVSTWTDKSGKGYNAVTYGAAPSYVSNKSLQFTGPSNINMRSPVPAQTFSNGLSLFVVFVKTTGANTYETLVTRTVTSEPAPFDMHGVNRIWGAVNNYISGTAASFTTYTTQTLLSITMSTSLNWLEYINGTNTVSYNITNYNNGSFGTPTWNDTASYIYIGTRADSITRFTGQISEILAYTSTLSTLDRQKVEGYLAWKWGLQSSLDASNPYKNAAPTVPNALGISRPANVLPIPSIACTPIRTYFLVTADLMLHLDAGNPASYPGSGSTWFDLTTSGINATLYGSPTYSSANGGYIAFTPSSSQYGGTSGTYNSSTALTRWTTEAWHYYTNTVTGNSPAIICSTYAGNVNFALGSPVGGAAGKNLAAAYYAGGWYYTSSTYVLPSVGWYHIVGTYDGTNLKLYVNNVLTQTQASATTPGFGGGEIRLMRRWDTGDYWGGYLAIARIYKRALSADEINTNYQLSKARFGLS